ncbi:Eco57I restriction-modification methylase domain-containing protein, partial [Proteus mirabilis]|uniref:Eco57I restriction-modification methylase domain-containing protein n=1 Tax=Proteus mirabilis TaxID=584 RepID=UPI001625A933
MARKRGLKSNIKTQQMKFDAIIGNPPYQMNIGEKKDNYGIPLYNEFMEIAREMKPQYISM